MNSFRLSLKSIAEKPLSAFLNVMLVAFGVGIITVLLLVTDQLENKLSSNSKDIDLVVGAKGSPLQLILSSVYHVDFPTGNILKKDADALAKNPMVKRAVPLAMGDNFEGNRIIGTDTSFAGLYGLKIKEGRFWQKDFEVTVGAEVASAHQLKIGSRFYGAHGLVSNADVHRNRAYTVTGILQPQGNVTDHLVLTTIPSVWIMHELFYDKNGNLIKQEAEHHHEEGGHHDEHEHEDVPEPGQPMLYSSGQPEITSMLIQYRSPMAVVMFPRMVNQSTAMQAASPAMESARLFSLVGVGIDTLQWLAILIMLISALSLFISLYQNLKERRYDMAIIRTLGASRFKLMTIILLEAMLIVLFGCVLGVIAGHTAVEIIGQNQDSAQAKITGGVLLDTEIYILGGSLLIGLIAGIVPAIQAYQTNISKTLAKG